MKTSGKKVPRVGIWWAWSIEHGAESRRLEERPSTGSGLEVGGKARDGILECWKDGILGITIGKDYSGVFSFCTSFQSSIIPVFHPEYWILDTGYWLIYKHDLNALNKRNAVSR